MKIDKALGAAIVVIVFCSVLPAGRMSATNSSDVTVSVLIDLGDGVVYWADVELTNNTAFNATEKACKVLGLALEYSWSAWGVYVSQIGDKTSQWPGAWWHLWLWNSTAQIWELSGKGADAVNCSNGDVIGWSYVVGWPGPKPLADPITKYPWACFRHDLYHTGYSKDFVAGNDVLWSFNTESWSVGATPAIARGKVFVTAWNGLYCLDESNGALLWKNIDVKGQSSPALYNDHVIVGSSDGKLYCLHIENGTELWNLTIALEPGYTGISSSPFVHEDKIFIGTFNWTGGEGELYCVNENDGTVIWKNSTESSVYFSSPAVNNGKIFIGTMGLYNSTTYSWSPPYGLYCFNETDGMLLWKYSVDNSIGSSPTILDNKVLFSSKNGGLYCLDENGKLVWEKNIGSSVSSPSVYQNKIFVGSGAFGGSGKFYCFNSECTKLWEYEPNGPVQSSPAIAGDKIYFATNTQNGTIYCLDLSGNLIWKYMPSPAQYILSSPALAAGKLFIGSDNGLVYCFGDKLPVATFTYTPPSPRTDEEITFDASSSVDTYGSIINYTWDFGDGAVDYGKVVPHK
ncbi:MAG: PQQ-binding-like beta-propeller repeat protein, partial [Candidatus Thermoplasmatota archaeon]|nr:PQQ-binding-like beta-propeller repeat protein [Candidatus Thermoplasmatota archaeon]